MNSQNCVIFPFISDSLKFRRFGILWGMEEPHKEKKCQTQNF